MLLQRHYLTEFCHLVFLIGRFVFDYTSLAAAKKAAEMYIEALKKELDDESNSFWNRAGFAEIAKEFKGLYNVFKSNAFFGKNTLSSIGGFEITDEAKKAFKELARSIIKAGINVVSDIAEGMFDGLREAGVFKRDEWSNWKPTLESIAQEVVDEQRAAKPAKMTAQQVKEGFEQLDTAEQFLLAEQFDKITHERIDSSSKPTLSQTQTDNTQSPTPEESAPFDATGLIPTADPAIYLKNNGNGMFVLVTDESKLDEDSKKAYYKMNETAKKLVEAFKNVSNEDTETLS